MCICLTLYEGFTLGPVFTNMSLRSIINLQNSSWMGININKLNLRSKEIKSNSDWIHSWNKSCDCIITRTVHMDIYYLFTFFLRHQNIRQTSALTMYGAQMQRWCLGISKCGLGSRPRGRWEVSGMMGAVRQTCSRLMTQQRNVGRSPIHRAVLRSEGQKFSQQPLLEDEARVDVCAVKMISRGLVRWGFN